MLNFNEGLSFNCAGDLSFMSDLLFSSDSVVGSDCWEIVSINCVDELSYFNVACRLRVSGSVYEFFFECIE